MYAKTGLQGPWYALGTEKRAGAQGWAGECGVRTAKRGVFKEDGSVNIAESQEKDFYNNQFSRNFWLPFGELFQWTNTGASQYEVS